MTEPVGAVEMADGLYVNVIEPVDGNQLTGVIQLVGGTDMVESSGQDVAAELPDSATESDERCPFGNQWDFEKAGALLALHSTMSTATVSRRFQDVTVLEALPSLVVQAFCQYHEPAFPGGVDL